MPRGGSTFGRVVAIAVILGVLGGGVILPLSGPFETNRLMTSPSPAAATTCASPVTGSSAVSPSGTAAPAPRAVCGRDPLLWPFSPASIWNLPIGANAVYLPGNIQPATASGFTTDPDILVLTPNAPVTSVYENNDGWGGGSRCDAQGPVVTSVPIPTDFVVPGASSSEMPNNAAAFLMPDGHTLIQGQPFTRCTAGGTATIMWVRDNDPTSDLFDLGFYGAHGGSMLSSIGGTIRLGELVPGGVIRHALKLQLYGVENYYYDSTTQGYRWPALTADSYASNYGGSVQALRMGSLLALPPSINVDTMGLQTEPAKILARTLQDYGGYIVDDTYWDVYAIGTEFSPAGRVEDEFQQTWGFQMDRSSLSTPWSQDMSNIFQALAVVNNWDAAKWSEVAGSSGTQGAGGGAPRVPWAPDLSCDRITLQGPIAGARYTPNDTVSVSWVTTGALQPNSVELSFSPDAGVHWDPPFATGQPVNGSTTWTVPNVGTDRGMLRAVGKNLLGNDVVGSSSTFVIDTGQPPPTVAVQSPSAGARYRGGDLVAVSWTTSGAAQVNSVSLSFSSDGGSAWSPPFATGQALNGSVTWAAATVTTTQAVIRAVAKAVSGADVEGRSGTFAIESGIPVARLSYGPAWPRPSVTVTFDATGSSATGFNATLQARWDWENDGAWDTAWSSSLTAQHAYATEGSYTVRLDVQDSTGPTASTTSPIVVDGTAPRTSASVTGSLGNHSWYTSLVTVTLSATDALSGVASSQYRIDNGSWQTYTSGIALSDGRRWLEFYSVDRAGVVEGTQSLAVDVDRTPPPFGPVSPTGTVSSSFVSIGWSASDNLSSTLEYETSLDGGPFVSRGSDTEISVTLPDGAHTLMVRARDEAGNTAAAVVSFRVDTNLLSLTGPYQGIPTYLAIAALIVGTFALLLRRRRRARPVQREEASAEDDGQVEEPPDVEPVDDESYYR